MRANLRFDGDGPDGDLRLDGEELVLEGVAVDGRELSGNEYRVDDESLTIFEAPARCTVTVRTRIEPERNTILEGLYKSGGMYCTQCEAQGFRRMVYYPDRPDVLSRFTTSITADATAYPVLLSNGNLVADETRAGRRTVTWEDPFPKPSYLFALVAGDLAVIEDTFETMSGRQVALRIYSEPHNIGQCNYAMSVLKRAMRWDEERFGREYDLDVFMIVVVESFNAGGHGEQGTQRLQYQLRPCFTRYRDRRRLPPRRGRGRPRIFSQLVGKQGHVPRLVPAQPEGRLHGVP